MTSLDVLLLALVGVCVLLTVINVIFFFRKKPHVLSQAEIEQVGADFAEDAKLTREILHMKSKQLKQLESCEEKRRTHSGVSYRKQMNEQKKKRRQKSQK